MEYTLDHIVLSTLDLDKMLDFYVDILQLQPERVEEYHAGKVPFPSLRLNADTIIDLFPVEMQKEIDMIYEGKDQNLNHFCMTLPKAEWQQLQTHLKKNDVEIVIGPIERWGANGNGTSIYFNDPDGNLIEVRYYN